MEGKRPPRSVESNQDSKELVSSDTNSNYAIKLNIIYTNADCLTNKRDELLFLLNSRE